MLDSAAVGAIIGAAARAGPEILKFLDRWLDRRHELAMQDKALAFEKQTPGRMEKAMSVDAGDVQAVLSLQREALAAQFNTGSPVLNAISILVRPGVTAALMVTYIAVKAVMVYVAATQAQPIDALLRAYGENDVSILSGILTFWFMSRSMEKGSK